MELRDIEYFTVLAEQGNIGRAAEILGLSQPAVSKSLRRLEDALQVKLFRRSHRGIALTAEGSVLLARTRDLRLSLQNIARELAELGEGRVTHLRIGVGRSLQGELLAAAFGKLLREAPRTTMQVVVSDADEISPALRNGELDLILNIMHPKPPEGLLYLPLYEEEFVVCACRPRTGSRAGKRCRCPTSARNGGLLLLLSFRAISICARCWNDTPCLCRKSHSSRAPAG